MGFAYNIDSRRVQKLKARLGYNWKLITPDEIDMAIRSINEVLERPDYSEEVKELTKQLLKKMKEQIPEYMI